jgi:hypothetical protein
MTVKYANKTCHKCGAKRAQPLMNKEEIYEETGKSQATISGWTWLGSGLGDKASQRAINRAGFNSGQRTYSRKKTVWSCKNCYSTQSTVNPNLTVVTKVTNTVIPNVHGKTPMWVWIFWIFVILGVLSLFSS